VKVTGYPEKTTKLRKSLTTFLNIIDDNIIHSLIPKQVEKKNLGELFCPVSERLQINFAFSDKACILYLF
jgi:hypothetical protein